MVIAGLTQQALQVWFPPESPAATVINLTSDDAAPITDAATPDGAPAPGTATDAAPARATDADAAPNTGGAAPAIDAIPDALDAAADNGTNNSKAP